MNRTATEMLPPRLAVVDDESQIHASIRLRLGKAYDLTCFSDPRAALQAVAKEKFDLCLVDIHMPYFDGLTFIERAKECDPALGYVVLSAFDSDDNLRRTIPLHVYDFISKPLPNRDGLEARLPDWIAQTRQRRHEHYLAGQAATMDRDLASAQLDREVEFISAESARDALLQTANLLTTVHAHLVASASLAAARAKADPSLALLARNLELGLKAAEGAVSVAEGFFGSGFGNRDTSPALVDAGLRHAVSIASRMAHVEITRKDVDISGTEIRLPIHGLSGMDFLLTTIPAIALALKTAQANSTVRIETSAVERLDAAMQDLRFRDFYWLNRRHAVSSRPGVIIAIRANALVLTRAQVDGWVQGDPNVFSTVSARGFHGVQKCRGLLGFSVAPTGRQFQLALVLPT